MRARVGEPGVDFELSASSDEANSAAVEGTLVDPDASSKHETSKEPHAPSSLVANPEDVSVSVRSSSDCEVVTTMDATFMGVALAARAAHILGVTLIITTNKQAGRWGDRLRSPACRTLDLVLVP